jgi:hypothetical protein
MTLAALLAPMVGCANLDPIALGECGNGVIDPGEDCDSFDRLDMTCRPPGGRDACRFDCSDSNRCTAGYACGQDALCRAPSGRFEYQATLSDPAKFIVAADFDANGEVDLLAGDDTGTVVSYQAGNFDELDTIDLSIDAASTLISGGQLTEDAMADVAHASVYFGSLGVSRGTPEPTLAGTVYPTLALAADHAVVFALDASRRLAGDEAMSVIDLPDVGTVLLEVNTALGGATPSNWLTEPGVLPSLAEDQLGTVRGGRLDPSKPCEQYVLAFRDTAFVGTPCTDDGAWNSTYVDPIEGPLVEVPIPVARIDLGGCEGDLDQAFVLDADNDGDLDVVFTPRGQAAEDFDGNPLCWLPGPINLPSNASANLTAESYPLVALGTTWDGEDERVLDLEDLNRDGVPDLVSSLGIFTSQSEPCADNLTSHMQAEPTIFFCSTGSDEFMFSQGYAFAAVGDVNGDQIKDVALAAKGDDRVQVNLGHGDDTFAVHFVEAEGSPYHLVFGDFDGDGLDDLMFADKVCPDPTRCTADSDPSDILTVAFGRVTGGPEEPRSLGRVPGIEALQTARLPGDFSGIDATVDLGVLARDPVDRNFGFAIMAGNTRRELQANFYLSSPDVQSELGTFPTSLALGRFVQSDDSGPSSSTEQQDIVVADFMNFFSELGESPVVRFWLADVQSEAKLSASRLWVSEPVGGWDLFNPMVAALVAADLDEDALDELVYASGRGLAIGDVVMDEAAGHPVLQFSQLDIVPVVRSTRFPGLEESISIGTPAIAGGSFGMDAGAGDEPSVGEDASISESAFLAAIPEPLQLGDVDGDGWRDIVLVGQHGADAELVVIFNDAGDFSANWHAALPISRETSALGLINLDADAGLEIVVAAGSFLTVYDGADQSLSEANLSFQIISEGGDVRAIETADFDRDGVPDLVFGHEDQMTLYRGRATDQGDD